MNKYELFDLYEERIQKAVDDAREEQQFADEIKNAILALAKIVAENQAETEND